MGGEEDSYTVFRVDRITFLWHTQNLAQASNWKSANQADQIQPDRYASGSCHQFSRFKFVPKTKKNEIFDTPLLNLCIKLEIFLFSRRGGEWIRKIYLEGIICNSHVRYVVRDWLDLLGVGICLPQSCFWRRPPRLVCFLLKLDNII